MPKENNRYAPDLIERLEQAQIILNEALVLAKKGVRKRPPSKEPHHANEKSSLEPLDFTMGIRGFVKRYAKGISGPKKFALLLAYLAKGDLKKTIPFVEIKKHWNNLTAKSLFGMEFNSFFASFAKENDWVNSEKNGSYNLRPSWKAIFNER